MGKCLSVVILFFSVFCNFANAWWQGGGTVHNWFDSANWSEAAVPNSSVTSAEVLNLYGISDWPILNNGSVSLNYLWIGGHYGHPGIMEIANGGSLTTSGELLIGQQDAIDPLYNPSGYENMLLVSGGSLSVTRNMAIGWKSIGNYYQTNGTVTVGTSGASTIYVGADGNGVGYMELAGGTFESYGTKFANRGTLEVYNGHVIINGGTARFGNIILIGKNSNPDANQAVVEVVSGQLNCDGGYGNGLVVGQTGSGKLIQSGGTINLVNSFAPAASVGMFIGQYEPAEGFIDIRSGATFTVGGVYMRKGLFKVNGGTVNINGEIWMVDPSSGRTDNFDVNAPEVVVNSGEMNIAGNFAVGHSGDAIYKQNGGVVNIGGSFLMSVYDGNSFGYLSNGTLNADNWDCGTGYGDAAIGYFEMSGGVVNTPYTGQLTGYYIHGDQGSNTFYPDGTTSIMKLSGGEINTDSMVVGRRGTGNLHMNGGIINVDSRLWVGTFTSGITRADEVPFVYSGYQNGYIELAGGQINIGIDIEFPAVDATDSFGKIDICGGTIVLDGDRQSSVAGWVSDGFIVACDGIAQVEYDYNIKNAGKTTIKSSCAGFPAGDLNSDCKVNFKDFVTLAENYLNDAGVGCAAYPVGDINEDCIVDLNDLRGIANSWLDDNGTVL